MFPIRSKLLAGWFSLLLFGLALAGPAAATVDTAATSGGESIATTVDRASDDGAPPPRAQEEVTDAHKRRRVGELLHAESPAMAMPGAMPGAFLATLQAVERPPTITTVAPSECDARVFVTRRLLRACRGRAPPRG